MFMHSAHGMVQRQTAVTAYFSSKQLLLFVFSPHRADPSCHVFLHSAVSYIKAAVFVKASAFLSEQFFRVYMLEI